MFLWYFFLVGRAFSSSSSSSPSGVRFVVDAGLAKRRSFAASTGMDTLRAEPCSQAEAKQRTGRAGSASLFLLVLLLLALLHVVLFLRPFFLFLFLSRGY
jgi:hypothetical protein